MLECLPVHDSEEIAERLEPLFVVARRVLARRGEETVRAIERGWYGGPGGERVEWGDLVEAARDAKVSLRPRAPLPVGWSRRFPVTRVQVRNETTLAAARRLAEEGRRPLALNFANGFTPGGGFLAGARAQEESLCRASALWATLAGDEMYEHHRRRARPDSTDWAILSPEVPVFREDDGTPLAEPWLLDFLTCAAPVAHRLEPGEAAELLRARIHRVLAIARAYGVDTLVLGAWGCGAFGNDPATTARDFRAALEGPFDGVFELVIFAIADTRPSRPTLGPFAEVFGPP